jgi:predicted RNA-binding Zn ribbon-like protein
MDVSDTGTRPAPGRLALVQAFINTNDLDRSEDRLGTADAAKDWFVRCGLLSESARVGRQDLNRIIEVREALRVLLTVDRSSAPDVRTSELEKVAGGAKLTFRFDVADGIYLEPRSPGVAGALGALLVICYESAVDGAWFRLKACSNDECRWVFFDQSKNRASKWCRPEICGNRMRARAHRVRQAAGRQ